MRIIVYIKSCIIAYTARSDLMANDTESIFGFKFYNLLKQVKMQNQT